MKISKENIDRVCEILDNNGDIVATGRIVDINDKHVKVTNSVGEMSLLKLDAIVKIRVHSHSGDIQTFDSRVKQSARNALYLTDVELLSNQEKREFFRVSVKLDTKAYPHTESNQLNENKSFKVKVKDLSLRGCFISTNSPINEGDKIKLVLPLSETEIYDCTVMRKVENSRVKGFGCSFAKFTSQQEDLICQFIFEEQRKMILKAKQFD